MQNKLIGTIAVRIRIALFALFMVVSAGFISYSALNDIFINSTQSAGYYLLVYVGIPVFFLMVWLWFIQEIKVLKKTLIDIKYLSRVELDDMEGRYFTTGVVFGVLAFVICFFVLLYYINTHPFNVFYIVIPATALLGICVGFGLVLLSSSVRLLVNDLEEDRRIYTKYS